MFYMTQKCFNLLFFVIISRTGEKYLKPEAYVDAFLKVKDQMYYCHSKTSGGYLSVEIKFAITIRVLDGGDVLDLGVIFDVEPYYCTNIMRWVLSHWIIKHNFGYINMSKYFDDITAMKKVSK